MLGAESAEFAVVVHTLSTEIQKKGNPMGSLFTSAARSIDLRA
jgi:hypothetical protein